MIDNKTEVLAGYKDLLSVKDLIDIFNVSKTTIYKEIRMGKFGKSIQVGRKHKFPKIHIIKNFFQVNEN